MNPSRLNTAEAIGNLGDDKALYLQIAQIFLDDIADQLAIFDAAFASGDHPTARRVAHTIKGTSATIGAELLHHHAVALEHACLAVDSVAIAAIVPVMHAEVGAVRIALQEYLAANSLTPNEELP